MRYLLCLLFSFATAASAQVASGQWLFQKRNANGTYAPYGLSWSNGQAVRLSGGVPSTFTPFDGAFSSLTGTLSLAQVPDALLTIAKTSGLQTALDAKLSSSTAAATYEPIIGAGTLALSKLAQGGATSGQVIAWNGTTYAPATLASGLTIDTTAISGGTIGNVLIHKTGNVVGELGTSTGGNGAADNGKLPIFGTDGDLTVSSAITAVDGTDTFQLSTGGIFFTDGANSVTLSIPGVLSAGNFSLTMPSGVNGALLTTGDTGTVTSTIIADGTLVNADISNSAAIALSKLATDPLARANHTGTQALATISDAGALAALNAVTTATITDGTIVDADISGSAAIAISKLASSSITIAGAATSLGGTISLDTITGLSTTGLVKRTGANTLAVSTLDANVETWIGTPSKANLNAAVSDDDPAYVGTANTFTAAQTFSNTTDASSKTTGAVIVSGGMGVAKTLYANAIYGYGGTNGDQLGDGVFVVHPSLATLATGAGVQIWNNWPLHWRTTNSVGLWGDAADTLWLRNSTRSQVVQVANTWSSATSYEAVSLWWSSNVAHVGTRKGSGGGSARDMVLDYDSTEKARVSSAGFTIGASGTAISQSTVTTTALDTSTIAAMTVREDTFTVSEATTTTPFSFTFSAAQNDDLRVILMRSDAGHIYVKWYNSNAVTARAPAGNITIRTWVP